MSDKSKSLVTLTISEEVSLVSLVLLRELLDPLGLSSVIQLFFLRSSCEEELTGCTPPLVVLCWFALCRGLNIIPSPELECSMPDFELSLRDTQSIPELVV